MAKYRWKTDFSDDYARLRAKIDRDYGERAYGDKERTQTSGMLKDAEPDYEMPTKPYKPQKSEPPPWEPEPQERIEPEPAEKPEHLDLDQLFEPVESAPGENDMLEIKSENIWEPLETMPFDAESKKKARDVEPEPSNY